MIHYDNVGISVRSRANRRQLSLNTIST